MSPRQLEVAGDATVMVATDETITAAELFKMFGCKDPATCHWHRRAWEDGFAWAVDVDRTIEWRREADGRWRKFVESAAASAQGAPAEQAAPPEDADAQRRTASVRQP